jgi:hypothetical protein
MIIQKITNIDAFKGIKSDNEWLVDDIDIMFPKNKPLTMNMIVDYIKYSRIVDVGYRNGTDLCITIKNVYGNSREVTDRIIIRDYPKVKNDPVLQPIERKIRLKLYAKAKKRLKQLLPKVLVGTAVVGVIIGGVKLYTSDGTGYDIPTDESSVVSEFEEETEIESSMDSSSYIDRMRYDTKVVKPPMDILRDYCSIYGFDDACIDQVYKLYRDDILNSDNPEETIMRCVYDFYTENLYKKIPTQYNINTEDEMESFIISYANVLGIDDDEILYTMLAVHELETGHGESALCLERNNLGGNIITIQSTKEVEFQYYPNAEVGAMDFVMDFYRIYKKTVPLELQDSSIDWSKLPVTESIEYYMNPMYCTEKMNPDDPEWYEIVANVKERLKENNRLEQVKPMAEEYHSSKGK